MKDIIKILRYTSKFKSWYILSMVLVIAVSLLSLASPFINKLVVDLVVSNLQTPDASNLTKLIYLFVWLFVLDIAVSVLGSANQYIGDLLSSKLKTFLYKNFYEHVLSLDVEYFDNEMMGTILNKMIRGVNSTTEFIKSMVNNFLPFFLTALITIIVLAKYSILLSVLLLVLFPIYILISQKSSEKWMGFEEKKNALSDVSQGRVAESLVGIRIIKAFAREVAELKSLVTAREKIEVLTKGQSTIWHGYDLFRKVLLNLALIATFVYIIYQTYSGIYTVGEMTLLLQLVNQARWPLFAMSFILGQIQDASASAKSYFEVMEAKKTIADKFGAKPLSIVGQPTIDFTDVDFAYSKGKTVLSDISFHLPAGKKLALVGESGQGKSTIVNLLLRFYEPQSGSIKVFGSDISELTQASLHQNIAVVLQDTLLFSGSVEENIRLGNSKATLSQVVKAAKSANAHDFIVSLPQGYKTTIGERGVKLSGGQKQRIAIARAMLKNAPLVILDEATSSLDSKSEHEVQKGLSKLLEGRTAIIIAHRLSTISTADLVMVIEKGRVTQFGTQQELLDNKKGLYSQLVDLQRLPLSSFELVS